MQGHVTSRWFVPGCTACSNEILCCVRGSWNWEWSNYFSCKLSACFPVTFQLTETAAALSLVHISQEMLYWTNLSHCIRVGGDGGGVTPLPLFYHHYPPFPSTIFPTYIFSLLPPPHPSDITWLFSNDVTWGRRRFAIWRPGWLRRLRWQCVGSWRRDGRGLYWWRQHCGCQWGAGWHDGLQLEGGYCTHLCWCCMYVNHSCPNVSPVLDHRYFWKRYSVPVRIYVVMLHGIP